MSLAPVDLTVAARVRAFVVVTAVLGVFLAAAAAPSPLYAVYAARWRFGPGHLTGVFAVYALTLLATLLTTGRLGDRVGRRPVILVSLAALAASLLLLN